METRPLGGTDMQVSVLGFGGSEIGYQRVSAKAVSKLLNSALDGGLNVIDTAECYLDSEEMIGEAVASRRKDYFLFSKCGHPQGWGREDWRPAAILRSIERSLKRLRTDYLDLIHLHSCSEAELRKGNAVDALEQARSQGYVRYIGYSGDGGAARYAVDCGRFDTLQTSVNLADQEAIELTLPGARDRGMGVIAKRPLANVAWRSRRRPADPYHHVYWERLKELGYEFLEAGLEESVSVALRFTLSVPVSTAIVGTTRPERWGENAGLLQDGLLPAEQFERIRARWSQVVGPTWQGQI